MKQVKYGIAPEDFDEPESVKHLDDETKEAAKKNSNTSHDDPLMCACGSIFCNEDCDCKHNTD
ncbi:MAG: hypothetical protein KKF39_07055 [Nanoarchaeota archaeon]|nr:hypothetical protein [Nanoarchaeota archaeon]